MNARLFHVLIGLGMSMAALWSTLKADELDYSDLSDRLDELEGIVAEQQESSLFRTASNVTAAEGGYGFGEPRCYDTSCASGGLYARAELPFLKPYISGSLFAQNTAVGMDGEYKLGPRLVFGYEDGFGFGVQVRYWLYDQDFFDPTGTLAGLGFGNTQGVDMDVVDLEATMRKEFCSWDLRVTGGLRYGRAELNAGSVQTYFEGQGPTISLDVARPVLNSQFSLLGSVRGSLLYGDVRDNGYLLSGPVAVSDEIADVREIQLGIQYAETLDLGDVAVQVLWENQSWVNNSFSFNGPTDLGFSGPTFSIQLRR